MSLLTHLDRIILGTILATETLVCAELVKTRLGLENYGAAAQRTRIAFALVLALSTATYLADPGKRLGAPPVAGALIRAASLLIGCVVAAYSLFGASFVVLAFRTGGGSLLAWVEAFSPLWLLSFGACRSWQVLREAGAPPWLSVLSVAAFMLAPLAGFLSLPYLGWR